MALFNYATKELTLKVVYYGPGLSGKTTNIQHLHRSIQPEKRGKLLSLATETDRTLFFDFLPVELGKVNDFDVRFQLYTVPGQIRYNSTRRLVLKGADAVVFVADSQREMKAFNKESLESMIDNLRANGLDPDEIPVVLQYNKRDLKNIMPVEELDADLNLKGHPVFLASAVAGQGVDDTFKGIIKILMSDLAEKQKLSAVKSSEAAVAKASAKAEEPVYDLEDMIERFGPDAEPSGRQAESRAAAGTAPSAAPGSLKCTSPAKEIETPSGAACPGNGGPPPANASGAEMDLVLPYLEEVKKALAGLSSRLDALGPALQGSLEKTLQAKISEAVRPSSPQPDPETGKRLREIKDLISGIPSAVSELAADRRAFEPENAKTARRDAQTEELIALAREIKRLQEESLSYLKQPREPAPAKKRKKGFFFGLF